MRMDGNFPARLSASESKCCFFIKKKIYRFTSNFLFIRIPIRYLGTYFAADAFLGAMCRYRVAPYRVIWIDLGHFGSNHTKMEQMFRWL
jgi:hypothetical protein